MRKVLVVADDLTGAADCAAASGLNAVVVLDDSRGIPAAEVVAIDADTRRMDAGRAAVETARIVQTYPAELVYKKIDSSLRGHVRTEVAAALEAYRSLGHPDAIAVVAPALVPAMGRITRDGRHYVRGVEIESTGLALCDAERDEDLQALVRRHAGRDILWAGSAALMSALMHESPKQRPPALPEIGGPILFAVGSQSQRSREQAEAVRESGVDAETLFIGESESLAREIAARQCVGALVLTGGDTARAVLRALGVAALRVAGEVETGVPILVTDDARRLPVVTKAGDFGDRETLVRCWTKLSRGAR